jgi:DNA modification methylase
VGNFSRAPKLLGEAKPLLMVTDPPYGVNYDPSWRNEEARKGNLGYYARRVGKVANDDRADWREAWALFPGDVVYSWHPAGATSLVHAAALQDSGFPIRMQIIWAKSNFQIGRGDYHVRHEPCWYAVRKGKAARRTDDRTQSTLWEINLDKNVEGGHSTQKPCECMERPIRNHEFSDVYDPFCGSGTTLIAAERENRRCYALEIDPIYCDVIVARWETFTGKKATLLAHLTSAPAPE